MDKVILYIHGKDGSPEEAEYYKPLFGEYEVIGFTMLPKHHGKQKKNFQDYLMIYAAHVNR